MDGRMMHGVLQITRALWARWGRQAGRPNTVTGRLADTCHIRPVNLQGRQVGSRGPLQIPPSEQGQPVVFMPFASGADDVEFLAFVDQVVPVLRRRDLRPGDYQGAPLPLGAQPT